MKSLAVKSALVATAVFLTGTTVSANDTMDGWKQALRGKIQSSNTYPARALEEGVEGTVKVRLRFAKNGGVDGVELVEKSGHDILDRRAFTTALRLSNLPALPEGHDQLSLIVPVRFQLPSKS